MTPQLIETYQYTDTVGNLLYEVCRFEPGEDGKKKTFKQRRVMPDGSTAWGLTKDTERVLYGLPGVATASEVFLCEGEKDVHTCRKMGLVATTNSGGAGVKWIEDDGTRPDWVLALGGKHVVLLPDNDEAGQLHAENVALALDGIAASFAVVTVPAGKDITEWITKEGGTPEQLNSLIEVARLPENAPVKQLRELIRKRGEPAAVESEKLLLGAMMNGTTPFQEIACQVSAADLSLDNHKTIFRVIADLDSKGLVGDIKAVIDALTDKDKLEIVGGVSYLMDLTEDLPTTYNIDQHIELVTKKSLSRQFVAQVMKSVEGLVVGGDIDEARAEVSRVLDSTVVVNARDSQMSSTSDIIKDFAAFFGKRKPGIMCKPLSKLSELTYGLHEGQLWVVAGRPSSGKSSLAGELCAYAAHQGNRTGIISLEVSKEECLLKMICTIAKVAYQAVISGRITEEQSRRLESTARAFMELPLRIDDGSDWALPKIRNYLKRQQSLGEPVRLLMLDYLQLMGGGRQDGRRDLEIGQITRGLKLLAKEFHCTIILLSQLNRDVEKFNRKPQLSDLRDSGSIEADADVVAFVWQDVQPGDEEKMERDALIILAKQRNGAIGHIPVRFTKPYTYFSDNGIESYSAQKSIEAA